MKHLRTIVCALVACLPCDAFQAESVPSLPLRESRPAATRLEGRVLTPAGEPAAGAVVVTNLGGKALVRTDGSFEIALELGTEIAEIRVSAFRSDVDATLSTSRTIAIAAGASRIDVGTIQLAAGAGCEPSWLPTFGSEPGTNGGVAAFAVFDDGTGSALYVAGYFSSVDGLDAACIAKWDGAEWSSLDGGPHGGPFDGVTALAVYDDGSGGGRALYVGGTFTTAGGVDASNLAKWDGNTWSAVGGGTDGGIAALAVFDDGSGARPSLFVAGYFQSAGGVDAHNIASWDGSAWSALGSGTDDAVYAMAVHDDGSGGGRALFVGGAFSQAGGAAANHVAKWDGASWSPLAGGLGTDSVYFEPVLALVSYDDGSGTGPSLFAGGSFVTPSAGIARWSGGAWQSIGDMAYLSGSGACDALLVHDDGSGGGPKLFAGGFFDSVAGVTASAVAKWDGSAWSALATGVVGQVSALATYDDGSGAGPRLYAGGGFQGADDRVLNSVASWSGGTWSPLGGGGIEGRVAAFATYDDGSGAGPALYVGGSFTSIGGARARHIAKWDGASWSQLGTGVDGPVRALVVHDDGSGRALFAGGYFQEVDGMSIRSVARWNGSAWSAVGDPVYFYLAAMTVHDDGSGGGPALYAAVSVGTSSAYGVWRWDGSAWSQLGGAPSNYIHVLASHDDGTGAGPALYAGGAFGMIAGVPMNCIARWDGSAWSALGGGTNYYVYALASHDDGSGPALFAGGDFTMAGGLPALRVAKWDGSAWSPLAGGLGSDGFYSGLVRALASYDDGTGAGPQLYAGGEFWLAGGERAHHIARWDGTAWEGVASGVAEYAGVETMLVENSMGAGARLLVGGSFSSSPAGDSNAAAFGGCAPSEPGSSYCAGDGSASACPCGNVGGAGQGCAHSSGAGAVLAGFGTTSVAADDLAFVAMNLIPAQPALLMVGNRRVNEGDGLPFGDGLRCAGVAVVRLRVETADANGLASFGPGLAPIGGWVSGDVRHFQAWYRDPMGSPCGTGFNTSNGYEVVFTD